MLKVFISSTSRDLKEFREALLDEIGEALEGVGMEGFIPRGEGSQKDSIDYLKTCQVVIFLITPYYGSLMNSCTLKESCKVVDCPMKTDKGRISFTHCEYKTTIAEDIRHQTYLIEKDWELIDYLKKLPENDFNAEKVKELEMFANIPLQLIEKYYAVSKYADSLRTEVGTEAYGRMESIQIPETVDIIKRNLADQIIEWHTDDKLNFKNFVDREKVLNNIIDNIDSKVEVWGTGGVGKTALIEVALIVQKLKGRQILTIGTTKTYTSGSGLEYFSKKGADDQYRTESKTKIAIYDVINAFAENGLLPNDEEIKKLPKDKQIEVLTQKIRSEKDLILFIDDFHLATEDVVNMAKSVDHLILSSRKNTGIARKEIYLSGIDEEDREDLINLFSNVQEEQLPKNVKKQIATIAEGHPVSTEILVKNYQRISNFDKLKDFNLENANQTQVNDFFKRVIEEIFSGNKPALELLKHLSVINTDLETNIIRDSVEKSYLDKDIQNHFNELIDTGMLKKKKGSESEYEFYFKHIQDYLEDEAKKESHEKAIEYYEKKREKLGENIDDSVEVLYHKLKSNPTEELVDVILEIKRKIQPVHYGFKRLIDVGEELKALVEEENKAPVLIMLGNLYQNLGRFKETETAYTEALEIYKELADKNLDAYNPDVAMTQNNLGLLYDDLKRFEEAEHAYQKALEIRKELADKNLDAYNPDVAMTQNNLGTLYWKLGRFEEAETAYEEALEIRKELADKNSDVYNPDVADTQNNLGNLYQNLGRFKEAETAYTEALEIYKELADKNPDAYNPDVAMTQNNLGLLYDDLKRFEEAEHAYQKALEIRKELADKNLDAYNPDVAMTQNNLGTLYWKLGRFEEAETVYEEALEIKKELADKNPDVYNPDVAMTQNNLGILFAELGRFEEAETAYTEALEIRKELADKNPDAYNPDVAMTQNNLGVLYKNLRRFKEAKTAYTDALKIRKELADKNPDAYNPDVAITQNNLGNLYQNLGRFKEAETAYTEALEIYKELADKYPQVYLPEIIRTLKNLRILYSTMKKSKEVKKITKKIKDLEKHKI